MTGPLNTLHIQIHLPLQEQHVFLPTSQTRNLRQTPSNLLKVTGQQMAEAGIATQAVWLAPSPWASLVWQISADTGPT